MNVLMINMVFYNGMSVTPHLLRKIFSLIVILITVVQIVMLRE